MNRFSLGRSAVLAGALGLLLGSAALGQTNDYPRGVHGQYANRVVEGTVASVVHERNGDRVRLTSGMDLVVPFSITGTRGGRQWGASSLQPGDVVRMTVFSREGDGRDAQVRSIEFVSSPNDGYRNNGYNNGYNNGALITGRVVSVDRHSRVVVIDQDNGPTVNVDLRQLSNSSNRIKTFRRGDRVSISGTMSRSGYIVANDVRLDPRNRH